MSHLIEVINNSQKQMFLDFILEVYKNDPKYRDFNLLFVKNFLYQKDTYSKRCHVMPVMVLDGDIKVVGIYIYSSDSQELKLSFLEFRPSSVLYLKEVLAYGKTLAKNEQLHKIVVGINGHISYGLGILCNRNCDFEYMGNYNPPYYVEELDKLGLVTKKAFSYNYKVPDVHSDLIHKQSENGYTFRTLDLKNFKRDMLIFSDICRQSFPGTPYYSPMSAQELSELMMPMRPLLRSNDMVFALYHDKEVGFVFTHPDYAQFFYTRRVSHFGVFACNALFKTSKVIVNSIGIIPEHRHKNLSAGLLGYASLIKRDTYQKAVSSFILIDNVPSTKISKMFSTGINREYNIYELEIS